MVLILSAIVVLAIAASVACYQSKRRFTERINDTVNCQSLALTISSENLQNEFDRIETLQQNITEIQSKIDNLRFPSPMALTADDDSKTSLSKLSRFIEDHSELSAGTEQFILSLLPTSQIGQSLHAMSTILPADLGHAVFGDALSALKDDVSTVFTQDGLDRFLSGMTHLGKMQMTSMYDALQHDNLASAALTPIKSGVMEALGVHDATHELANSLTALSSDMGNALQASQSLTELTSLTDMDISGHIPVATIAFSSFREIQLLADDKTDFLSSIKNISFDVAGSGIGAFTGAKAGAMAGSLFGPLGAMIGGIVGTIGGAVAGRSVSNKAKRIPLDNAIQAYESNYQLMKHETDKRSRQTVSEICTFTEQKQSEFHNSDLVDHIPTTDTMTIVEQIAMSLYSAILNEIAELKYGASQLRKSVWYSENKYDAIIVEYENQLAELQRQLPDISIIERNPRLVIETLLALRMPNRTNTTKIKSKLDECSKELKTINDKNDSALLVWSYMVNNLYQKTLNDIADYSNEQMTALNQCFAEWERTMNQLMDRVNTEKSKLGLN